MNVMDGWMDEIFMSCHVHVCHIISCVSLDMEHLFICAYTGDYFGEKALMKNTPREATIQVLKEEEME